MKQTTILTAVGIACLGVVSATAMPIVNINVAASSPLQFTMANGATKTTASITATVGNVTMPVVCTDMNNSLRSGLFEQFTIGEAGSMNLTHNPAWVPGAPPYTGVFYAAWIESNYNKLVKTRVEAAALQLAVWNVLYDTDFGLGAGTFKATPAGPPSWVADEVAAIALANNYLTQASAKSLASLQAKYANSPYFFDSVSLVSGASTVPVYRPDSRQDIMHVPGVPDAGSTLMLLGGGFIGLAAVRRRLTA